jgi:ABC-type Fe3+ transport system permease subunit/DNA-binding beta-propeller fold protein YncE
VNWPLLQNSLLVAGTTTALAVGVGLIAALWLATLEPRGRNAFLALAIAALALPPFLVTNCWINLLGETGTLRSWLPLRIYSLGGTIWILSLMLWPITAFAMLAAWRRLEAAQFECEPAMTGFVLLRWLLLPVARGELALAAVVTFVLALNNFAVPAILQTKVLPDEMWIRFNTQFDAPGALKLSVPLILGPALLLAWAARRGVEWPRVQGAVPARVFRRQLGFPWRTGGGAVATLLCASSAVLPLAQIVTTRRTWAELGGAVEASTGAIWNSFWFAALTATLVTVIALGQSSRNRRREEAEANRPLKKSFSAERIRANPNNFEGQFSQTRLFQLPPKRARPVRLLTSAATSASWLPFFIPGVFIGIALITIFNRPMLAAFYQSIGIVLLALAIRYCALAWAAARHALAGVDADLTDAARLEGASRGQLFRLVVWPQIAPQMFAAWYVVYLLCLWDVESIVLIQPPGGETLALRIFNLLHYGYAAQVNALCLTLLGLAVLPLILVTAFARMRQFFSVTSHEVSRALTSAATVVAVAAMAGCSPSNPSREARLQGKIFERAEVIGSRGVGIGEFNKPRSVAVDLQDNVYAVDMTGRVQKFSPDGRYVLSWQMPQTTLGKPKGMGRDRAGNILVVEPHYQRVNHFTPEGRLVAQWGCHGTNAGCFTMPRAVAVNSRGEVFVSEYTGEERVQRFAPNPKFEIRNPGSDLPGGAALPVTLLSVIGRAGTGPGEFNRAEGICVDAQDRLYVADSCNHRIQIFSSDGKFLREYGQPGSGLGELSYPYDIAVDAQGNQFVCEFGNSRIQVFDANCRPVEIIGGPGAAPGRFANPWSVALDAHGNLYVADSQNHRLQKLVRRNSAAAEPTRRIARAKHDGRLRAPAAAH